MRDFDPNSAYRFMETLVKKIGNRESGTDSEKKAALQIKAWFEKFGLTNVRLEEFDVRTSRILKEDAMLSTGKNIECSAVGNSLSTPRGGVEGEVAWLESTAPEALRKIKGRIAALGIVLYKEDFQKVVSAEPLALIYLSKTPLAPTIHRSIRPEYTEKQNIPAISMAHDNVLKILKGRKKLKITTKVQNITAKSQNVLADAPGTNEGQDMLIGGHYDTVRSVIGAHDNAAGTAMVVELARIFAHTKYKRTLRFAAFGSEELGLCGSFNYAENPENVKDLRLYLNFDVHGILLGTLNATILGSEDLKSYVRFTAKEVGAHLQIISELGLGGSDHMPLSIYGVPSVYLSREGGAAQIMHTDLEDLRWCGPDAFVHAGKLSKTLLERLSNAEELPFEKDIPKAIAKALEKRLELWGMKKKVKEQT